MGAESELYKHWMNASLGLEQQIQAPSPYMQKLLDVVMYRQLEKPEGYSPEAVVTPMSAVLVSGGLDSTVLYLMTKGEKAAHYFDIGQPYADKERASLAKNGIPFMSEKVEGIPNINTQTWKHVLPARNLLFAQLLADKYPLNQVDILFASTEGEMPQTGGDKSYEFLDVANEHLAATGKVIKAPIQHLTKTELVSWAVNNGHEEEVRNTISCYGGGESNRCGKCPACYKTWVAFSNNGIELDFDTDPLEGCKPEIEHYRQVMGDALRAQDFSHYTPQRIEEHRMALERVGIPLI